MMKDDAGANADAGANIHKMGKLLAGAEPFFAKRRQFRLVFDDDRILRPSLLQGRCQRHIAPTQVRRKNHRPAFRMDNARHPDADSHYAVRRRRRPADRGFNQFGHLADNRLLPFGRAERTPLLPYDFSI